MVDQLHHLPHGNGLEPAGDTRSDEQGLSAVSVDNDVKGAQNDETVSGTDGIANQSDPPVIPPNENDTQEQMNVVNELPSQSPTGNKDEEELNTERVLVSNTELALQAVDVNEEKKVAVIKTELELLPEEKETTDDTELNRLELDTLSEQVPQFKASGNQKSFLLEPNSAMEDEPGTEEDQAAFMKELEIFHKERCLEFKPPRFYGEPLNCLKLWRSVIRLGGYEQVTSCKLWRQVGESFKPPKTCTTVSWTFRCFYEKALLEYEKYMMSIGELPFTDASSVEPATGRKQVDSALQDFRGLIPVCGLQKTNENLKEFDLGRKIGSTEKISLNLTPGSGRARRDAAARAMQGWHSQRLLGNGEVGDPIIKDKNSSTMLKREKQFKSIGLLKRKKPSSVERAVKVARMKASKPQLDSMIVDIGPPADWVKINVQRTKDCFEVYALVPGLLREEVRVQSDPAGRLVISGQPEQLENPWGVAPFKKVVSLPSRIDPHQTSAVVTLHGQLFVRVPFEQLDL